MTGVRIRSMKVSQKNGKAKTKKQAKSKTRNVPWSKEIMQFRTQRGMSQTEAAMLLGVSYATLNRWENKHHEPVPIVRDAVRRKMKES